ncbi:ScpA family protein [Anaerolinea sp.]|uniref:segregation and condensation protein A n=1 Tax=Anaerolinea sp. TaxID=1872519 RepID=UPI002610C003|nr:segregation/condensation protein A [uncultured Anaerolinea sp.]
MSFQVAGFQTEGYRVQTPVYEGPLDLLLELIERAELDITTLALAQVTDQYLSYLSQLEDHDAAEVSAFLVIAARLVQIKSAALLPRPAAETRTTEEENPGEALARQLIIYKRFKELAEILGERESRNLRTYLRLSQPSVKVEARLDLSGVSLQDLVQAARGIFISQPDLPALSKVVSKPRITIREKIQSILENLRNVGRTSFRTLIAFHNDRLEWIVTFLAMLELVKRHIIQASQQELFGEIELSASSEGLNAENIETEFIDS